MSKMSDKLKATTRIKASEPAETSMADQHVFRTAPGRTMFAHQQLARIQEELKVAKAGKVEIAQLHEVAGRRRVLSQTAFDQLKSNLEQNPLTHAIVVRTREAGGFEIIAGHNRVEAYRQLGRMEIEADIRDFDDAQVLKTSLYSNLFQSDLSAFEKYLGFKHIRDLTGETQEEMARKTGVSRPQVTQLFAFEKLSPKALQILEKNPAILGYDAAAKLANAPDDKVIDALLKLAKGEISESSAIKEALIIEKKNVTNDAPLIIRNGKKTFAQVKRKGNLLAITIKDPKMVDGIMAKILELLESNNQ